MSILRGVTFWIMCTAMWLLATPALIGVIAAQNFTGIEAFLMGVLPWAVLLALVGRVLYVVKGGEL